jgi:hypothetical protein
LPVAKNVSSRFMSTSPRQQVHRMLIGTFKSPPMAGMPMP